MYVLGNKWSPREGQKDMRGHPAGSSVAGTKEMEDGIFPIHFLLNKLENAQQ